VPVGYSVRHAAPPAYPTTNNPLTPDTLDVWQREVVGPLSLLRQPVRLLIDGFDQLRAPVHEIPLRRPRWGCLSVRE
jgi:hypothetical protein